MDENTQELLIQGVKDNFRDAVLDTAVFRGEVTHLVDKGALGAICNFLKTDPRFKMNYLVDVAGADYYPENPRFEVVYHLYSISRKHRLRLKIRVAQGETA